MYRNVYMAQITFKQKIRDIGTASVVTVPAQYMKDGILWTGEECEITIKIPVPKKYGE